MPRLSAPEIVKVLRRDFSDILPYTDFPNNLIIPPRGTPGYKETWEALETLKRDLIREAPRIRQAIRQEEERKQKEARTIILRARRGLPPIGQPVNIQPVVLQLDNNNATEQKIAELLAEEKKVVPEGYVRVTYDIHYETRVDVKPSNKLSNGWRVVANYSGPPEHKLLTPIDQVNRIINENFYDALGYDPQGVQPCETYNIPKTSQKTYLTAFIPTNTENISQLLDEDEYKVFDRVLSETKDAFVAMTELYRALNMEFLPVRSQNPGYPDCYRYLYSSRPIITRSGSSSFGNNRSSNINEVPLFGVLDKYTLDNILDITKEDLQLYKLEGTTYGDKTGNCVPYAIRDAWHITLSDWEVPDNGIYNANWLSDFAEKNSLSLLIVDSDNTIIKRNIGSHDVMNHKKTLVGVVLENHLSIVTDNDLRKSLLERAKSQDSKMKVENKFELDNSDSDSEDEEDKKKAEQRRSNMLADYKSKSDCHNLEELRDAMIIEGNHTIYYHGLFSEAIALVINNNVDSENVGIIPRVYGKNRNVKCKNGKIVSIKYKNHWIRPANDSINLELFEKLVPLINDPMYKDINPQMNINELMSGVRSHYLKDIYSVLNNHTMSFLNSDGCIEPCKKLFIQNMENDKLLEMINEPVKHVIHATDISKAFQMAACSSVFGDFAKYTGCEIYVPYDGSSIIRQAFYFVKSNSNHPFYRGHGPYEGNAVISMLNYGIILVDDVINMCVPFDCYAREKLEDYIYYVNKTFGPRDAKDIINKTIGCMKPNLDKVYKQYCLTTDINVLHSRLINTTTGKPHVETIALGGGKSLWNISRRGDFARYRSAHPMRMAIIDRLLCITLDIYGVLSKIAQPLFVKTDCLYYISDNNCNSELEKLESYYRNTLSSRIQELNDFARLKILRYSDGKEYCNVSHSVTENATQSNVVEIDKELSFNHVSGRVDLGDLKNLIGEKKYLSVENARSEEFIRDLSSMEGALIESPGGHGKTDLLLNLEKYLIGIGCNVLKCAFTNAVKLLTNGNTFHSVFRMSVMSNRFFKIERNLRKTADSYDVILCDECSMITGDIYECLAYMKSYKPSLKIFLFGNWRQCKPVEPGRNVDYSNLGLVNCIVSWNYVSLTKNWRVDPVEYKWAEFIKNPDSAFYFTNVSYYTDRSGEQKEWKVHKPSNKLLEHVKCINESNIKYPINIAYTNAKCKSVNNAYVKKLATYLAKNGLSFTYYKDSDSYLFEGLRLIGRVKVVGYKSKLVRALDKKIDKNIFIENGIDLDELKDELLTFDSEEDSYINEHYVVEWVNTSTNTFCVRTNSEFHDYIKYAVYRISDLARYFKLGYCFTVHSVQGLTIKKPYIIHEFSKMVHFGTEILYTALSRASNPNNINIVENILDKFELIDNISPTSWMDA